MNGEIYNYRELTEDLVKKGHRFATHSDTETVVHLYEEYGKEMLPRLNGMFALALFDMTKREVLFAVDRTGKKPLYWASRNGHFLFASEPKAFYAHPEFQAELNMLGLQQYLAHEYVPAPQTIFKDVFKMEPAHYMILNADSPEKEPASTSYWNLTFEPKLSLSEGEYCANIRDLLKRAVQRRLMSEVPLGVFLSGGIDSSSIVAMMAELMPPKNIKSFSIAFEDPSFDESSYARQVAVHFGTDHHEEVLSPRTMLDILPQVAAVLDEPFADASVIPTYLLSRFTRQQVTVALGGDGGDELFAGYDTFSAHQLARFYEKIPRTFHTIFKKGAQYLPVSTDNISFDFKVKRFLSGMDHPKEVRNQVWLGTFSPEVQQQLLVRQPDASYEEIYGPSLRCEQNSPARSYMDHTIYAYFKTYLMNDILVKVDRASMANSLEVRAPFLDVELIEFVNCMPDTLKINGLKRKYILKKALEAKLPVNIIDRPKKGFGVPISEWFKNELKPLLYDEFSEEKIRSEGIFNAAYVGKLLKGHFDGRKDNRKEIWTLLMFQLWKNHWLV
jgi:asparagine synthase (glutamine-hydrolysing)